MSNVVHLDTNLNCDQRDMVNFVRDLADKIMAGEITAFAMAMVYDDGAIGTGYVSGGHHWTLAGAVSELSSRIVNSET